MERLRCRELIAACKSRNKEMFETLVKAMYLHDASPTDRQGDTVAHYCYKFGFVEGVEIMLNAFLDTHAANKMNALPIHAACENDQTELVLWHLEHNNVDEEYSIIDNSSGFTPYMWAVSRGNMLLLKHFVSRGYLDPNAVTNFRKNTAFTLSIQHAQPEVALFLWQNGLQGALGVEKPRPNASIMGDIIACSKRPEQMFQLMEKIGRSDLLRGEIKEQGISTLIHCIQMKRHDAFVCMVKRGIARPSVEYDVFRDFEEVEKEVRLFVDKLNAQIKIYTDFQSCFLLGTTACFNEFECAPKRRKKTSSLRKFDDYTNRLIAEFLDIPFGRTLLYLREAIAFLESLV